MKTVLSLYYHILTNYQRELSPTLSSNASQQNKVENLQFVSDVHHLGT